MTEGERDRREEGHRAYFTAPRGNWEALPPEVRDALASLQGQLATVLADPRPADTPTPAELALQLGEGATALFEAIAPEERSLRQVITTLRTGLALCWDMYSFSEADRTTVRAHMDRLEAEIANFEAELRQVQGGEAGALEEGKAPDKDNQAT